MEFEPIVAITGYEEVNGEEFFQVKWKYGDVTLEPVANLNCPGLMEKFTSLVWKSIPKELPKFKKKEPTPTIPKLSAPMSFKDMRLFRAMKKKNLKPQRTKIQVNRMSFIDESDTSFIVGSMDDNHFLPATINLTRQMDIGIVYSLLNIFLISKQTVLMDIFRIEAVSELEDFKLKQQKLLENDLAVLDFSHTKNHPIIVCPFTQVFHSKLKKKGNILGEFDDCSMLCIKLHSKHVFHGNHTTNNQIFSHIKESEAVIEALETNFQDSLIGNLQLEQFLLAETPLEMMEKAKLVRFGVFGPTDTYELQEWCQTLQSAGATYFPDLYSPEINAVVISKSYLQYLHLMPNLLKLKWKYTTFHAVGRRLNLTHGYRLTTFQLFCAGGQISVTRRFLLDGTISGFSSLLDDLLNGKNGWEFKIPKELFERFKIIVANEPVNTELSNLTHKLQKCVYSEYLKPEDYMNHLQFQKYKKYRHFIIIDRPPFTLKSVGSIQVVDLQTAKEMVSGNYVHNE